MTCAAIIFIVFNRPIQTGRVFEAIRSVRPAHLYVAADGPRQLAGDVERCEQVRRITQQIDWPCQLKTLFQPRNLGCGVAVRTALDWFFAHEREGIVLEDDCLPSQSFFRYCTELLNAYRNDTRIMSICGSDFLGGKHQCGASYYYSLYHDPWGWATWRRAWKLYDFEMKKWPAFRASAGLKSLSDGRSEFELYWETIFNRMHAGNIDTWDYPFIFSQFAERGLTCRPAINMITNIGHYSDATHTKYGNDSLADLPNFEIQFPLCHPSTVVRDVIADQMLNQCRFGIRAPAMTIKRRMQKAGHRWRRIAQMMSTLVGMGRVHD
jgi:hypothetical protein